MAASRKYFSKKTFEFLTQLALNNNREWFEEHKGDYEAYVREPALAFISDFAKPLKKISPHFNADARKSGGSLFRIYRDVRFSKDKSPYKTYTGIQFRHALAKDVHAPGFYLHVQPKECFAGVGVWHPDGPTTAKIREAIVDDTAGFKRAAYGKKFSSEFALSGDSLKRPPRGFDAEHPLVEDLKRKDFIGVTKLSQREMTGDLLARYTELCRAGSPLVKWLCKAVDVPF